MLLLLYLVGVVFAATAVVVNVVVSVAVVFAVIVVIVAVVVNATEVASPNQFPFN